MPTVEEVATRLNRVITFRIELQGGIQHTVRALPLASDAFWHQLITRGVAKNICVNHRGVGHLLTPDSLKAIPLRLKLFLLYAYT